MKNLYRSGKSVASTVTTPDHSGYLRRRAYGGEHTLHHHRTRTHASASVYTIPHTHTYSASLSLMAAEGVQLPSTSDEPDTYSDCDAGTSGA